MADKKDAPEIKGIVGPMVSGLKSLTAAVKEQASEDRKSAEARADKAAKNSDAVKFAMAEQATRQRKLIEQGVDEKTARFQAQKDTVKVLQDQKDLILKNNPALTILAPLNLLAKGAKAGLTNASKAVEEKRKNFRLSTALLNGIQSVERGVIGLGKGLFDQAKERAKALSGNLMGILKKVAFGAAAAAIIGFMNSKYWEDTKVFIMDEVVPALASFYENVLKPIGEVIKDVFIRGWEDIKELFSGIGDAITQFQEGDILGGISTLIGSLGTFFIDTVDNLITGVYNLFAKLFGLEETDSVGGSIKNFFVGLKDSIVNFFVVTIPAAIESALSFLTQMTDKVFGFFSDIWTKVQGIFGEFSVFQFLEETLGELFGSIKALFGGDFSLENLGSIFGSFMDIVYAPLNLAINTLKDIFGFGNPDEPFRLSEFIMDGIKKIGEFFAGLFDLDIRALASSIMPSAVVDFLFGKKVDTESDEFKSMSDLDQAKATGLYDKDLIGNSEVNANLIGKATTKQLQAILNDDDIDEKTAKILRAEIGKRDGAGEFTGTENSGAKEFLLPASARSGIYGYRGTEEYEDILASQNQRLSLRKRVKFADMKYNRIYGTPVSSNDNRKNGQAINDSSSELNSAKAEGSNVVIMGGSSRPTPAPAAPIVPLPVATRDSSSSAANSARVYY